MASDEKLKALDAAISNIEKQFGKGSIMKLGESNVNLNVESIPTGSLSLDIALGLGGVPRGRVVEIYGPESSGKTTVALHMVAEVQKRGGIAGFIDAEHALDPVYAKNIGVDIDNLYISQPDSGEQALEITETMVRSGAVDIMIFATAGRSIYGSGWFLVDGILTVLLSIFLLCNQMFTMMTLPYILGMWLLFSGITKFVNSFDLRRFGVRGWGWVTAFGLLMAAAGFLSFMDPLAAAVTLSVLAGLFLMIQGVVSIAFGCLSGRFWM